MLPFILMQVYLALCLLSNNDTLMPVIRHLRSGGIHFDAFDLTILILKQFILFFPVAIFLPSACIFLASGNFAAILQQSLLHGCWRYLLPFAMQISKFLHESIFMPHKYWCQNYRGQNKHQMKRPLKLTAM